MPQVGFGLTVKLPEQLVVQPLASVMMTLWLTLVVALVTVMLGVVAPVSHKNVYGAVPPVGFAVKVAEPPAQTCAVDTVMLQVGFGSITTVAEASASAVEPKPVLTPCACTLFV